MKELFLSLILILFSTTTSAIASDNATDFLIKGQSARPLGMGGAFVAVADDSSAPLWNPAGLSLLTSDEILTLYSSLPDFDMKTNFFAVAIPSRWGNWELSWLNSKISDIPKTSLDPVTGRPVLEGYFNDEENGYVLSYSNGLNDSLLWGINIKHLSQKFTTVNYSASGSGIDVGLLYKISKNFSAGICAQNIVKPKLKEDTIPTNYKFGFSSKLLNEKLLLALDADFSTDKNLRKPKYYLGAEYSLHGMLFLRGGWLSGRTGEEAQYTAGVGLRLKNFQVDYAYNPHTVLGSTQVVSLLFRFGRKNAKDISQKSVEIEEKKLKKESPKVETAAAPKEETTLSIQINRPAENEEVGVDKNKPFVFVEGNMTPQEKIKYYEMSEVGVSVPNQEGFFKERIQIDHEGQHEVKIIVYDKSGNTHEVKRNFSVQFLLSGKVIDFYGWKKGKRNFIRMDMGQVHGVKKGMVFKVIDSFGNEVGEIDICDGTVANDKGEEKEMCPIKESVSGGRIIENKGIKHGMRIIEVRNNK